MAQTYWEQYPKALDTAKALQAKNRSSGYIAKELCREFGWVSRSAVVGKLSRFAIKHYKETNNGVAPLKRRLKRSAIQKKLLAEADDMPPLVLTGMCDLPYELPATAVDLYHAKPHHCRWPVGHRGQLLFCGATITPGSGVSYCPHHFRRSVPRQREVINDSLPKYR